MSVADPVVGRDDVQGLGFDCGRVSHLHLDLYVGNGECGPGVDHRNTHVAMVLAVWSPARHLASRDGL